MSGAPHDASIKQCYDCTQRATLLFYDKFTMAQTCTEHLEKLKKESDDRCRLSKEHGGSFHLVRHITIEYLKNIF
jgi:hypothetical protein